MADALVARGFRIWLDRYELQLGDSVYDSIDDGLRKSRFGVVILSRHFFAKNWPQRELHALAALSAAEGSKKILPVWHGVDHKDIAKFSPLLSDVLAENSAEGIEVVADQIARALGPKAAN